MQPAVLRRVRANPRGGLLDDMVDVPLVLIAHDARRPT
jgi:hypothetical protein